MLIVPRNTTAERVHTLLWSWLDRSRFTCDFEQVRVPRRRSRKPWAESFGLKISRVRLRIPKLYCGQHAGPCPIRFGGERPHKLGRWLEGSDWVGFDDFLNDVLDRYKVEADVWQKGQDFLRPYFLRLGRARRILHPDTWVGRFGVFFQGWECENYPHEFSEEHFGSKRDAPRAAYPAGTPGIAEWRAAKTRKIELRDLKQVLNDRKAAARATRQVHKLKRAQAQES